MLEFRILGPLEVASEAGPIRLGGPRQRAGLAILAFTSVDVARDLVRLAVADDADLVLVAAPPALDRPQLPGSLAELFHRSPAHVAVLAGPRPDFARGIVAPFGGGEHESAALEVTAALARSVKAVDARRHEGRPAQSPARRQRPPRGCRARAATSGRIGSARRALVTAGRRTVLLVHRGPRPGALAPRTTRTRFTWTLAA